MFRSIKDRLWAFDMEWVPDPLAGRLVYRFPDEVTDPEELMRLMWGKGGATPEDPTPFLKLSLCRVVSISAVERRVHRDGRVTLNLVSLPRDVGDAQQTSELAVVGRFLDALGEHRPQLVGFNSIPSDLKILIQRGVMLGVAAPGFCSRPEKPWEGIDYFARGSEWNIDLRDVLGSFGKANPSLHEIAVQSGIPGKMEVDGNQVARLWLDGELARIVGYNECDALTTYLVWLRMAHFAGHFTRDEYAIEQQRVRDLVEREAADANREHLTLYLREWDRLRAAVVKERGSC